MLGASVNFIFASIFVSLAWWSLPRGWNFIRLGWQAMQDKSKDESDNTGLSFFLSGLAWFIAGLFAAIIAAILATVTIIQISNSA